LVIAAQEEYFSATGSSFLTLKCSLSWQRDSQERKVFCKGVSQQF